MNPRKKQDLNTMMYSMKSPWNMCCCCLSTDCYKDITNEYYYAGSKEVYAELFLETFNITISDQNGSVSSSRSQLICNSCITSLRDATMFKKKVLHTKENFASYLEKLQQKKLEPGIIDTKQYDLLAQLVESDTQRLSDRESDIVDKVEEWKEEQLYTGGSDDDELVDETKLVDDLKLVDDMDENAMEGFDNNGQLLYINTDLDLKQFEMNKTKSIPKIKNKSLQNIAKAKTNERKNHKEKKSHKPLQPDLILRQNSAILVINSNICLFRSLKIKYQCFFCTEQFIEMKHLRLHTESTHTSPSTIAKVITRGASFKKAEITNLTCKLCCQTCHNIENLQDHLKTLHDVHFEGNKHHLVPYRITEDLKCALCNLQFKSFMRLSIHMNSHYSNFVCDKCGASFVTKVGQAKHVDVNHKPVTCKICFETVVNVMKYKVHLEKKHKIHKRKVRYCPYPYCKETFLHGYMLKEHKITMHGLVRETVNCTLCTKVFKNEFCLKMHVRGVHLKERKYTCDFCESAFFKIGDKKRHERTHGGEGVEKFKCDVCTSMFKNKDSWRRHVRKQHAPK